jgi:hypothetical protein
MPYIAKVKGGQYEPSKIMFSIIAPRNLVLVEFEMELLLL